MLLLKWLSRKNLPYVVLALTTLWFAAAVLIPAGSRLTHGFAAYYSAARLLRQGKLSAQIYQPAYFRPLVQADSGGQADDIFNANPPPAALLLWPLSSLSVLSARRAWTLINAVLLWAGLAGLVWRLAPPPRGPTLPAVLTMSMLFRPVIENFTYGQAYIFLFALLCLAVAPPPRQWPGGAALGLALLLKIGGWALLPALIWHKQGRRLAWAGLTLAAGTAVTLPLFGSAMWAAYFRLAAETARSPLLCAPAYQTVRSLTCQIFGLAGAAAPGWLINMPWLGKALYWGLALFTLALTLRRTPPPRTLAAALAWGVLFAPLGELYHHTVLLIPLIGLVIHWRQGRLTRMACLCTAAALALYVLPLPPGWLPAYPYVVAAGLVWLAHFSPIISPGSPTGDAAA